MMNLCRSLLSAATLMAATVLCFAQTEKVQVIENGGTGSWKSVAVGDAGLPTHTIYRPDEKFYAVAARLSLNWQLKGKVGDSALFMNDEFDKALHPDWTFDRKNC